MSTITEILDYFISDPLRILTLIGGSGGAIYWYDRYQNRSRLNIRIHTLGLSPRSNDNKTCIRFEAENRGTKPMSLEPYVSLRGMIPTVMRKEKGRRLKWNFYNYYIDSTDRSLPPHQPKTFEAIGDSDEIRPFLWFMTYTFTPTRGRVHKVRMRSADKYILSFIRYIYESILYTVFNKIYINKKII